MSYNQALLLNASERATEGYERIGKKLAKMREILKAEIEKNKAENYNLNGNGNKKR